MLVREDDFFLRSLLLGGRLFGSPDLKVFRLLSCANGWTVFGTHALASMTSLRGGNFGTEKGALWVRNDSWLCGLMINDNILVLAAELIEIE